MGSKQSVPLGDSDASGENRGVGALGGIAGVMSGTSADSDVVRGTSLLLVCDWATGVTSGASADSDVVRGASLLLLV